MIQTLNFGPLALNTHVLFNLLAGAASSTRSAGIAHRQNGAPTRMQKRPMGRKRSISQRGWTS